MNLTLEAVQRAVVSWSIGFISQAKILNNSRIVQIALKSIRSHALYKYNRLCLVFVSVVQ